jgi:hypothetical protein
MKSLPTVRHRLGRLPTRPVLGAVIVVLLALALRTTAALRTDSLWRDEANDIFVCRNSASVSELFATLRAEGSPPLRFLLERAVDRAFPNSVGPARAMAVLYGTLAVGVTVATGWVAFGPQAGLLAGFFMATSPFFIRYTIELRGYGLYQLASALYGLAMVRLLGRRTWTCAVTSGVLGGVLLLTHYYGFFLVGAATAFAMWRLRRCPRGALGVSCSALLAALVFSPWLPSFLVQATSELRPWAVPNRKVVDLVRVLDLPYGKWSPVWLAVCAWGALVLQGRRRPTVPVANGRSVSEHQWTAWGLLVAGAVGGNAVGWFAQFAEVLKARLEPPYLTGMAVWLMPPVGMALMQLTSLDWPAVLATTNSGGARCCRSPLATGRRFRRALLALVVASVLVGQAVTARTWLGPRSPAPVIAALIEREGRSGDLILVVPAAHAASFNFYYRGDLEQWAPPFRGRVTNVAWTGLLRKMEDRALLDDFKQALARHLQEGRRVWLISGGLVPYSREFAWADQLPRVRTAYERADLVARQQFLRILYTYARAVPQGGVPRREYWEPTEFVLFEPLP